jgi:hypothetical protein
MPGGTPRKATNRIQLNRIVFRKRGTVPSRGGFAFRSETPALINESPSETGLYPFFARLHARHRPFYSCRNEVHPRRRRLHPVQIRLDSRQVKLHLKQMKFNPPRMKLHPRQMKLDLRQMKLNLRQMQLDLRQIKASGPCPGGVL